MKTPDELFRDKQANMNDKELIDLVDKQISELAKTGGRSHRMCVPPMVNDTDMLLSEMLRRFKLLVEPAQSIQGDEFCPCNSDNYGYGFAKCFDCGKIKQ